MSGSSGDAADRRAGMLRGGRAVLSLALLLVAAGPVEAAGGDTFLGSAGGLDYYSDTTFTSSAPGRAYATVLCPDRAVGGGVFPQGPTTETWVSESLPYSTRSWRGAFFTIGGADKTAQVYLVCTSRKVRKGTSSAKRIKSGESLRLRATCPPGTHATGGGTKANDNLSTFVRTVSSYPIDDGDRGHVPDDGWSVLLYNWTSSTINSPVITVKCLEADGVLSYLTSVTGQRYCPDSAHVIGGGIKQPKSAASHAWMNSSHPVDAGDQDAAPDDAWRAVGRDLSNSLKSYAICLN